MNVLVGLAMFGLRSRVFWVDVWLGFWVWGLGSRVFSGWFACWVFCVSVFCSSVFLGWCYFLGFVSICKEGARGDDAPSPSLTSPAPYLLVVRKNLQA